MLSSGAGRRWRWILAAGLAAAVLVAAIVLVLRWRYNRPEARAGAAATALVAALSAALDSAATIAQPYRCARWPATPEPRMLDTSGRSLVIGAVADARGATPQTLQRLEHVRAAFVAADVDLVVSLGGLAEQQADIAAVLGTLTDPRWTVVAIPGDREDVGAHRRAIAGLRAAGRAIWDGGRTRLLQAGDTRLVTFPGAAYEERLVAGAHGCVHAPADARAAAQALGTHGVLLSYVPPRQDVPRGSDVAPGDIHVGEPALADATAAAAPAVVLHAMVDPTDGPVAGRSTTAAPLILAAGAVQDDPFLQSSNDPAALIVTIEGGRAAWRRVLLNSADAP